MTFYIKICMVLNKRKKITETYSRTNILIPYCCLYSCLKLHVVTDTQFFLVWDTSYTYYLPKTNLRPSLPTTPVSPFTTPLVPLFFSFFPSPIRTIMLKVF